MQLIKKIALLVHEPTMFAHYSSVWAELDHNSLEITINLLKRIAGRDKNYLVNPLDPIQYPPLQAGISQIRQRSNPWKWNRQGSGPLNIFVTHPIFKTAPEYSVAHPA